MSEYAYIGRAECGCIRAASVDGRDKDTAKDVARFVRDGLVVERVTIEFVRSAKWVQPDCATHKRRTA